MRTGILKVVVVFVALILLLLINDATNTADGKPGLLWPILSVAFVGFLIAVVKWKPNKKDENDNNNQDKHILKKD